MKYVARICARGCPGNGVGGILVGKLDVDKGGNSLNGAALLCVLNEVFLAGLVFGIPIKDIKLRVVGSLGRRCV